MTFFNSIGYTESSRSGIRKDVFGSGRGQLQTNNVRNILQISTKAI